MNETLQSDNKRAAGVITTSAFVSLFVYSLVVSLPAILINEVVDAFSLEGTDEGLMGALTSFGFLISIFFVVLVQGRAQKITVLVIALIMQALVLAFCGFSHTFLLFCIGCTLIGFSGGFIDTFCNSAVVDAQKEERAKYLGFLHGLFGVGSLLAPILFVWALIYMDWRGVHYALAAASVLVVIFIFLITRGVLKKNEAVTAREHLFTKADIITHLRNKHNVILAFASFFAMFTIACTMMWIVRYMTVRYDAADLGALSITVYWICSTINRFLSSKFTKRAPMKVFTLGAILSGIFLLIGILSGSPVVLCVMIGAVGFCSGHFVPVLISSSSVGNEGRTTFTTSFIMFVMCLSRISAPIIMAFFSTHISLTYSMIIPVVSALAVAVFGWLAIKTEKMESV